MSEAEKNLREHQQQLDADGVMVGVSRQALVEVLEERSQLRAIKKRNEQTTVRANPIIRHRMTAIRAESE